MVQRDPVDMWIDDIGGLDSAKAASAFNNLRSQGQAISYHACWRLGKGDPIGQNKIRDVMREITGKNFGFDAIKQASKQDDSIAKWQEFINQQ